MGAFLRGFLLGAVAGFGSALLQAPRPGRETQAAIRSGVENVGPSALRYRAGDWLDQAVATAETRRPEIEDRLAEAVAAMMQPPETDRGDAAWTQRAEVRQQVSAALDQLLALGRSLARDLKEEEETV